MELSPDKHLENHILYLADTSLILGHRLSEWCGHGPILEQDIALTNIALDLIGEARNYLQLAGTLLQKTEDELAFLRDTMDYKNLLLVEQPNNDFAHTIARQFFFDVYHYYNCQCLMQSTHPTIAAIATKSLKEVSYHLKFSAEWIIRLGDGTDVSHQKMQTAIDNLWAFTGEMLLPTATEIYLEQQNITPNTSTIPALWHAKVDEIIQQATVKKPEATWFQQGGKHGKHTENLGFILAEMQFLQRAYPHSQW